MQVLEVVCPYCSRRGEASLGRQKHARRLTDFGVARTAGRRGSSRLRRYIGIGVVRNKHALVRVLFEKQNFWYAACDWHFFFSHTRLEIFNQRIRFEKKRNYIHTLTKCTRTAGYTLVGYTPRRHRFDLNRSTFGLFDAQIQNYSTACWRSCRFLQFISLSKIKFNFP